jgi:hypothetical protein
METLFFNALEQCWQFEATAGIRRSRNIGGQKTAGFRGSRTEGVKDIDFLCWKWAKAINRTQIRRDPVCGRHMYLEYVRISYCSTLKLTIFLSEFSILVLPGFQKGSDIKAS